MRTALFALAAVAAFATSAAGGYAMSERSSEASTATVDGSAEAERRAHASAVEYVLQEFADKPMERMQFLSYEDAVHGAMTAAGRSAIDEAATTLLRAQDCAGILNKGHRTTITRDLILDLHDARPGNPRWKRVLVRASEIPSDRTGDPCRSEEERRAAPLLSSGSDPIARDRTSTTTPFRRAKVFHIEVDPKMRRRARADSALPAEPVRMRLD